MFDDWDDHNDDDEFDEFDDDDGDDVMALFDDPVPFAFNHAPAQQFRALPQVQIGAPNNQVNIAQEARQQQDAAQVRLRLRQDGQARFMEINRPHALRVNNPAVGPNIPAFIPQDNAFAVPLPRFVHAPMPPADRVAAHQFAAEDFYQHRLDLQHAERHGHLRLQHADAINAANAALVQEVADRRARLQARGAALQNNPPANFQNAAAAAALARPDGLRARLQAGLPAFREHQLLDHAGGRIMRRQEIAGPNREMGEDNAVAANNFAVARRQAAVALPQHVRNDPGRNLHVKQEQGQRRVKKEEDDYMD